ncbi:MAG: NapC/NirT family cytochrome c, partial [Bacteroidales bacterium]|nr:NapC/NirT family cytochrome c [Bacteroidales bacterium]
MKLPKHYYSWTTFIGGAIALISFFMIVILFLVTLVFDVGDNYSGLFTFIILPAVMFMGIGMALIGRLATMRRKRKHKDTEFSYPVVDFNDPKQRFIVFLFTIGLSVFVVLSALGGYQAFHFTESNQFCGTLCHAVMEPEYTAYQGSAHARVKCVECHVGSGAGWYVKSKLSGLYQVYSVMADAYPRPIPTP